MRNVETKERAELKVCAELRLWQTDDLTVQRFSVVDPISALFHIQVVAIGAAHGDVSGAVGRAASLAVPTPEGPRTYAGVCASVRQTGGLESGLAVYEIVLAPQLWLLTHRHNHRIFHHQTAPAIAQALLREWHIEPRLRLRETHPALETRVQYGESDYAFLRRLLGGAGISFYFDHAAKSAVVFADEPQREEDGLVELPFVARARGNQIDRHHVYEVRIHSRVFAPRATFVDHDFRKPKHPPTGHQATAAHQHPAGEDHPHWEERHFVPGHSMVATAPAEADATSPLADGAGHYRHHPQAAHDHAARHLDARRAAARPIAFHTSRADLSPGTLLRISGHPHPDLAGQKKLLVVESWLSGGSHGEWAAGGEAVSTEHPFRPSLHRQRGFSTLFAEHGRAFEPRADPRGPRIEGVQSATVVGPTGAGASADEPHTDEHGRVRVQFAWDREGKRDGKSSGWVRVAQASAGTGAGRTEIPQVGQEVLVGFVDGDPHHPIIVGQMHNHLAPAPYALPAHKTRSTWKSRAHEITFDDRKNNELFYMQSDHHLHKLVMQDELEHTGGDRHVSVDGDLILSAKGRVVFHSGAEVVVKGAPHIHFNPSAAAAAARVPAALASGPTKRRPAAAASANQSLFAIHPGSVPAATSDAAGRRALAEKYQHLAIKLGRKYHLPPAFLLGWMSQESGLGSLLRPDGYSIYDGYGYGLLQVDRRYHTPTGDPFGASSIEQGIKIYQDNLKAVAAAHPDWTHQQQMAGALVEYNSGPGNAQTQPTSPASWAALDQGTAPDDRYSRSVWVQSEWFAKNLDW